MPLRWEAIRRRTVLFRATKRGVAYERATRLLAPLADDLQAWCKASGEPPAAAPVIPNRRGAQWSEHDWDNWRNRTFRAAARAAGLPTDTPDGARRVRPRDLRSSFATLLIYEGQPPQYVAEQLGHSAATLLRDYARVWQDFDPSQRASAEEQIERVRRRETGDLGRPEGVRARVRRTRATPRRAGGVPLVFRDDGDGDDHRNSETPD